MLNNEPKYTDNLISKKIVFNTNKHSPFFGTPYLYTENHRMKDRTKRLNKLSQGRTNKNFFDTFLSSLEIDDNSDPYSKSYNGMPQTFSTVKGDEQIRSFTVAPTDYAFIRKNPPFELRLKSIKAHSAELIRANNVLRPRDNKISNESNNKSSKHYKS